jgi:hypothetical protein
VVVGEQNPSSQGVGFEFLQGLRISAVVQLEFSSLPPDFHPKDLLEVLAGGKILGMGSEALPGVTLRKGLAPSIDHSYSTYPLEMLCEREKEEEQTDRRKPDAVPILA